MGESGVHFASTPILSAESLISNAVTREWRLADADSSGLLAPLPQHLVDAGHLEPVQLRESLAAADPSLPQDMVSRIGEAIQRDVG